MCLLSLRFHSCFLLILSVPPSRRLQYSIKSQSKGAGRQRFTVLIKTSRSSLTHANPGKIAYILKSKQSEFYGASWAKGSGSGNYTMPGTRPKGSGGGDGGFGGGKDATKRREGEAVGEGAAHLGEENLGHKLLSKMGWSQGDRIGKGDGGLNQPIMAIVKVCSFFLSFLSRWSHNSYC
jgi:hypothetical protein